MPKKQILQVLEAAIEGCNTTHDVANATGLRIEIVSNYVSELIKDGTLKRNGKIHRGYEHNDNEHHRGRGRSYLCFEVA